MNIKVGYSTPLVPVAEIEKSILFYQLLGFTAVDTDRCKPLGWARIHCEGGAVMFVRAEHAVDPSAQAILLYMYTPDLAGLREHLLANDINVSAISYPEYMPSGEVRLSDPDGYTVLISHWGESEQAAWQRRISTKP